MATAVHRKIWSEAIKRRIACEQDYKCAICKQQLPPVWHADHKIPLHIKEDNRIENCQILCALCHAEKTQMEMIRLHEIREEKRTGESRFFNQTTTFYPS